MRINFTIGLFAIITITANGQEVEHFFARSLKEFAWTSDELPNVERIARLRAIPLSILKIAKDSLKVNRTIWNFKDSLTITHYDAQLRKETILAKIPYDWRWDKGLVDFQINDTETLIYRFTFVSTGSFILLTRKRGEKVRGGQNY